MNAFAKVPVAPKDVARIASERQSQRLVTAFVSSGLVFMLLPGTFLGVWNLLSISEAHGPGSISQAWLQAHGQAQVFGWVGSFILGIGFYSLTKMRSTMTFPAKAGWTVWALWTTGVLMHWLAGVTGDAWRVAMPLSGALQLAGFALFYRSVRKYRPVPTPHKPGATRPPNTWMKIVAAGTVVFLVTMAVNFGLELWDALRGGSPALPHVADEKFVTLAVWGVLVPTIWGFNSRWLPIFLGLRQPNPKSLYTAYGLSVAGVITTYLGLLPLASVLFLLAALLVIEALHVWQPAVNPAKLINVHHSFPWFVRLTYGWLVVSCVMALMAVPWDHSGGIWGGSRHALTVGFVAGMVFAIGQRVLPAFCGMKVLWSTQLMFWSLFLLYVGCSLRVFAEPLAYEGIWAPAWKILPVSAVIELTAVTLFALNLFVTLALPPAHLRKAAA
ncbi:MAG: NnrS family protein [Acidobacteriaceae bacterium]